MAPAASIDGISEGLRKIMNSNMDEAPARRSAREAFKEIQLSIDHCLFKISKVGVKSEELYRVNSRGVEIFCKSWLPEETSSLKALVFFCHGYGDTCTFFFEGIARRLVHSGFGVFSMDYPGFGLSEGLHGYLPDFDTLVGDVDEHFSEIKGREEYREIPSFLFGQSMGGAVALLVHLSRRTVWTGAVLIAPMCKLADDMVPPWLLMRLLTGVARFFPRAKLVPQKDIAQAGFKDPTKRTLTAYNVMAYRGKPRLGTALEVLRITEVIERRMEEVSMPLLVIHGEADTVTDPSVSRALYEKANSSDKKLLLYQAAFHCILEGESDDTAFRALDDIVSWLAARALHHSGH